MRRAARHVLSVTPEGMSAHVTVDDLAIVDLCLEREKRIRSRWPATHGPARARRPSEAERALQSRARSRARLAAARCPPPAARRGGGCSGKPVDALTQACTHWLSRPVAGGSAYTSTHQTRRYVAPRERPNVCGHASGIRFGVGALDAGAPR